MSLVLNKLVIIKLVINKLVIIKLVINKLVINKLVIIKLVINKLVIIKLVINKLVITTLCSYNETTYKDTSHQAPAVDLRLTISSCSSRTFEMRLDKLNLVSVDLKRDKTS